MAIRDLPEDDRSWGHAERYYSAGSEIPTGLLSFGGTSAAARWGNALERAWPGIRDEVERAVKRWNAAVRDCLRTETGLRLSAGETVQQVPVKVDDGVPRWFELALEDFVGLEWLLLSRPALESAVAGTSFMEQNVDEVRSRWGEAAGPADAAMIRRVRETAEQWLTRLDQVRAIERILEPNEDVLGAYFYRVPEIKLYWVVIGFVAVQLGVSVESLTVVVLAHELAHAYTHLGLDIDGECWNTNQFAGTDLEIVEGLAQFYTQVSCARLEKRLPSAITAYEALLKRQSGPYRAHLKWVGGGESGGEIVRVSMIECRSKSLSKVADFESAVARYRADVRGGGGA
jgi:hypothetical protein